MYNINKIFREDIDPEIKMNAFENLVLKEETDINSKTIIDIITEQDPETHLVLDIGIAPFLNKLFIKLTKLLKKNIEIKNIIRKIIKDLNNTIGIWLKNGKTKEEILKKIENDYCKNNQKIEEYIKL